MERAVDALQDQPDQDLLVQHRIGPPVTRSGLASVNFCLFI